MNHAESFSSIDPKYYPTVGVLLFFDIEDEILWYRAADWGFDLHTWGFGFEFPHQGESQKGPGSCVLFENTVLLWLGV